MGFFNLPLRRYLSSLEGKSLDLLLERRREGLLEEEFIQIFFNYFSIFEGFITYNEELLEF